MPTVLERFESKYEPVPECGCWLWTGTCYSNGYGQLMVRKENGKWGSKLAHRLSWEFNRGRIPEGLQVLHRCDVPSCVNPNHLFVGTPRDNMSDCVAKGRHFSFFKGATHCVNGHEFTAENTRIKKNKRGPYRACRQCGRIQRKKS